VERQSRSGAWVKTHQSLTSLLSTITLIGSAAGFAWTQWDGLSTESETRAALNKYDHGYPDDLPDPEWKQGGLPLKTRTVTKSMDDTVRRLTAEVAQARKNEQQVWWWLIGYVASDVEPCGRLRAAAAAFYRAQFKRELQTEDDLETAYTKALNTYWHQRQALTRQGGCK
jgi:hypothetical protein